MYSKLPPEDEQFIYSKHVEGIYWNKFKNKVHLVGSYYANLSQCTVHIMSMVNMFTRSKHGSHVVIGQI